MSTESTVLRVHGLHIVTRSGTEPRNLVEGLDLSIERGKILGLIGESGCGKSLTCLALMGLLPPGLRRLRGEILIDGVRVDRLPEKHLRPLRGKSVAMILQNPMSCFDPVFTIRDHFRETLASHGIGAEDRRTLAALEEVGFEQPDRIQDLYPFQMSGGMLQRVMIAIALLMKPPLLLADEPTTDLDVVSQALVMDLLLSIRNRYGTSILLVTHDLGVVGRLCDEAAVMRRGVIIERGPVARLFHRPRHPYTQSLIQAHRDLHEDFREKLKDLDHAVLPPPDMQGLLGGRNP